MKAFITGSRAYGTPYSTSDVDLVVLVSEADLAVLIEQAEDRTTGSGGDSGSLRFGRLNLIAQTDLEDYQDWKTGTVRLTARRPVSRDFAITEFRRLFDARIRAIAEAQKPVGVETSLYQMVRIVGTRPLWPADFEALVKPLDVSPNDKSQWGVLADWLDEHDEPELAEAARWIFKRDSVRVTRDNSKNRWFFLENLPGAVSCHWATVGFDTTTLPGLTAVLAVALAKAREDIA